MTLMAPGWAEEAPWTPADVIPDSSRSTKIVMPRTESGDGRNHLLMRIAGWTFIAALLAAMAFLGAAVVAFSQMHLAISLALLAAATGALAVLMREATKPATTPEPEANVIHYPESMDTFWTS